MTMATPNSERLLGVITDDDVAALDARNRQRARQAIMCMGARYCLHGANSPMRTAPDKLRRASDWPAVSLRDHQHKPVSLPEPLRRMLRGNE